MAEIVSATINSALHLFHFMKKTWLSIARLLVLTGLAVGFGACKLFSPTAPTSVAGSCGLNLPPDADAETSIRALLAAEGTFVVEQQITPLMQLWADDSFVANAKNTPDDTSDDQFWHDKDAIRHRYVRTVFPGAPSQAVPADLHIELDGSHAVVIATTQIGSEVSPAGDRWELVQVSGCWLIQSLTYNLEPLSVQP